METEHVLGHLVQFDPIEHKYYVDGTWVPSVSQICKLENPTMYKDVDQQTLNLAAAKGVGLHEEIEQFELHGVMGSSMEFNNYLRVKQRLGFQKKMTETIILIKLDHQVICAGRFDLLALIEQEHVLIDFKRTSDIHRKYVKLQLNLYRLGLKQCYHIEISKLLMIRLRGYEANIIAFDVDEEHTYHVLSKYKHLGG
jgi:ATP-dependent exoDNAse (exonuclease V) beta subunit